MKKGTGRTITKYASVQLIPRTDSE